MSEKGPIVRPLFHGDDPENSIPSSTREALVGDGVRIIGSVPNPSESDEDDISETIQVDDLQDDDIYLGDPGNVTGDEEDSETDFDLISSSPATIYANLIGKYGNLFLSWEPETLRVVLQDDFDLDFVPDSLWEMIMAIKVVGAGAATEDYVAFEKAALAVAGSPVVPGRIQHVSPSEMAELCKLMKEIYGILDLSDEVERYIAARLFTDGFLFVGDVFPEEVQKHIMELGAPRELVKMTAKKVGEIVDGGNIEEDLSALAENAVDIQVARYFSLI